MTTKFRFLIVFLLAAVLLFPTSPARADPSRIDFTGSELCPGDTLVMAREWMASFNYQGRVASSTCYDTADIPQMTGTDYLGDGRFLAVGAEGNFLLSGKLRMETTEGGVWVGSWELSRNSTTIKVIGHGEGLYEGLQLHWFLTLEGPFSGYITGTTR